MKVVEVRNGIVQREYTEYTTAEEARRHFAPNIEFADAPDTVWPGYGFDPGKRGDARFIRPLLNEGWDYDENGQPWNPEEHRSNERRMLHSKTTNDTMQALRKIREGDTSIDWDSWLAALDAYNLAIEDTRHQEGYPNKVVYPEYPEKPSA